MVERRDRAGGVMTVGMILEDLEEQILLGQLFLVVAAELDPQVVPGLVLEAAEIVLPPARFEQHRPQKFVVFLEILGVGGPHEHRHFLIDLRVHRSRHRKQGLDDLVVALVLRSGFGEHRGRQGGGALLALGIERRSGPEEDAEGDQRRIVRLRQQLKRRRDDVRGEETSGQQGAAHQSAPPSGSCRSVAIVRSCSTKTCFATRCTSAAVTPW